MNRKNAVSLVLAVIAAAATVLVTTAGSWDRLRYTVGAFEREAEQRNISETLDLFGATYAGFYVTGGNPEGLRLFPAEMLIKRRIFMEINTYREAGVVYALDRDRSELKDIQFLDLAHAVAVADESWFMMYQDAATRRSLSAKRAMFTTVRYFLKKRWGKWNVLEYEVYGRDDTLPPFDRRRVIAW